MELAGALFLLADSLTLDLSQREKALSHCRDAVAIFAARLPENDARLAKARSLEAKLSGQAATAGRIDFDVFVATLLPIALTLSDDQLARSPADWAAPSWRPSGCIVRATSQALRAALKQGHIAAIAKIRELCSTGTAGRGPSIQAANLYAISRNTVPEAACAPWADRRNPRHEERRRRSASNRGGLARGCVCRPHRLGTRTPVHCLGTVRSGDVIARTRQTQ